MHPDRRRRPGCCADQPTTLAETVKLTGTAKNGKKFNGTYTIERFTRSGSKVLAVGTRQGQAQGPQGLRAQNVRIPATLERHTGATTSAARRTRPRAPARSSSWCCSRSTSTCSACTWPRAGSGPDRGRPRRRRTCRQPAVRDHRHPRPAGRDAGQPSQLSQVLNALLALRAPHRVARAISRPVPHVSAGRGRYPRPPCGSSPASSRRAQAPRQLHRRDRPVRRRPGPRRRRSTASSTCTRSTVAYDPPTLRERVYDTARDADRRGPRPGALHPLPPVRRPRAHRAVVAAVGRHAARRAQPHAPVPRQVGGPARARLRRAALLSGADGRRRARLPRRTRCRSARTSASTSS